MWPIWNKGDELRYTGNYGSYIYADDDRSSIVYPKGAAFISDEDIFSVFKDTDLKMYQMSASAAAAAGLPFGIQYEQAMYSWGSGILKDVVVLRFRMINTSKGILKDCYFAPVVDPDIATKTQMQTGTINDRTKYLTERPDLRTGIAWTDETAGEKDFGVMAVSLLETPAVYANGELRKDKKAYHVKEQLGLHTFRNWSMETDPATSEQRYEFMSSGVKDGDNGPGEKKMMLSVGPFTMQPGDTAHFAFALSLANRQVDPATSQEIYTELIAKIEAAHKELYPDIIASVESENLLKEKPAFISCTNDAATLHFKSGSFKNLRAELFNALGERVMTIHSGEILEGETSFKTSGLPAGMYYCVITSTSSGERMTLPMTIVR